MSCLVSVDKPDRRYFTSQELATVRSLRAQGMAFRLIGERLDRDPQSLSNVLRRPPQRPADVRDKHREHIVERFVAGIRIVDLAKAIGITQQGVIKQLVTAGMDREMRQLARAELAGAVI